MAKGFFQDVSDFIAGRSPIPARPRKPRTNTLRAQLEARSAEILALKGQISSLQSELQRIRPFAVVKIELEAQQARDKKARKDGEEALARERAMFAAERQRLEEALANERKILAGEQQRLAKGREDLNRDAERLAMAQHEHSQKEPERSPIDWTTASADFDAHLFSGKAVGGDLIVNYFFDPRGSGMVLFRWKTKFERPVGLSLFVCRDDEFIREETGVDKGNFPDGVLEPNRRYYYDFELCYEYLRIQDTLTISVVLPPHKPLESTSRARSEKELFRERQYRGAEEYIDDPQQLKARKAEIDAAVCEKYGED